MMRWRETDSTRRGSEAPFDAVRYSHQIQMAFGGLVLAWIVCVGAYVLHSRPVEAPQVAAVLPALASAGPALDTPGRVSDFEPASLNQDLSSNSGFDVLPPASQGVGPPMEGAPLPPARDTARTDGYSPLPPSRPSEFPRPLQGYDKWTAVYVIAAHTVYLPDGTRLEAHSGLGDMLDDARYVNERDRGPIPPHVYELTPREELFHGVQALRLNPIGDGDVFGRDGLLAHPYMLGPKGDSNGCVSFKDYDAFLRAYQNGQVKRLAVVSRLDWQDLARLSQR